MAYSAITNAEIDQDSPITQTLMTKYRDNILATKGMVFLASSDASSSATLDFTAFDSALYDAYFFVLSNVIPASNGAILYLRTSSDGGSTFDSGASAYAYYGIHGEIGSAVSSISNSSFAEIRMTDSVGSEAAEDGVSGSVLLAGPHLAERTHVQYDISYYDSAGAALWNVVRGAGVRKSAADVDAVRFLYSTGNIASGTITMYGMWNAA